MSNTVTLYHYWRSSSSWRVRWALAIKGIEFASVPVNLLENEQNSEAHRARNPAGYVPTLEIDGHLLTESVAILEYLEETRPSPALYPREALWRARVRQVCESINAGVQPLQNLGVLKRHSSEPAEQKRWAAHFNERGLQVIEALLLRSDAERGHVGRFAIGDDLTAADLYIVPQVYSARRFGVDVTLFPRVIAAETAALASEHARAALPENQPGATTH